LENPGVNGRIILRYIFTKWVEGWGIDWINLALDRDRWRAHVKAVINLRGPIKCGEILD